QPYKSVHQVSDVAERARLRTVPVNGDRLLAQGLHDEIGDHAPVVRMHVWPVGVEYARNLDLEVVLTKVVEEQRLRAPLALVVARPRADRIDVAPIFLGLWVLARITIDFAGGGLENPGAQALCQSQHVDCAVHRGLGRLYGI